MTDRLTPVGELIARHRRRRGLSQAKLGELLDRSVSWVSQVERGARTIDSISTLEQIADILEVPASEFVPESLLPPVQREHPAVTAVRRAMSEHKEIAIMLGAPDDAPARDLAELAGKPAEVWDLVHASRYNDLQEVVPAVLPPLETAARRLTGDEQREAFRLLAILYQAITAMMAKLGEPIVAWVAADRARGYAERGGHELLARVTAFRLAHAFLSAQQLDNAQLVATSAADALAPSVQANSPPERISVWGALNLVASVIAARLDDAKDAHERLSLARQAADWLGEDRNDFDTEFGPTNVLLHAVAIAVDLGDAGEALRTAATIDASRLSRERQARFLIDVARAHEQRRQSAEVLAAILRAEELTPEQVRAHPYVHRMVGDLLREQQITPELRSLAQRLGLLR